MGNFDSMSTDARFRASSRGGRNAHRNGNARTWTTEQARAAAAISVTNRRARQLLATQTMLTGRRPEFDVPLPFDGCEEGL